jgi:hypothetical protein
VEVARANPEWPKTQYFPGVAYVWAGDKESMRRQYRLIRKMDAGFACLVIDAIYHIWPQWMDD